MNLLLIEDEKTLLFTLQDYLEKQGYQVSTASSYRQSVTETLFHTFDCIIVDIGLPDGNGLDLIRHLKGQHSKSGIIIISAKNTLDDKLMGLELGSDDYLTKPFDLPELNARIKSVLRRRQQIDNPFLTFGVITLDPKAHAVYIHQQTLTLTHKEYELLLFFISNPNRLIDKAALAKQVWGNNMDLAGGSHDFIYTHIKNLRKKLTDHGSPDYLKTRYGVGYIFTADE